MVDVAWCTLFVVVLMLFSGLRLIVFLELLVDAVVVLCIDVVVVGFSIVDVNNDAALVVVLIDVILVVVVLVVLGLMDVDLGVVDLVVLTLVVVVCSSCIVVSLDEAMVVIFGILEVDVVVVVVVVDVVVVVVIVADNSVFCVIIICSSSFFSFNASFSRTFLLFLFNTTESSISLPSIIGML